MLVYQRVIGNVIIPTDEVHDFSEGFKPPTSFCVSANEINLPVPPKWQEKRRDNDDSAMDFRLPYFQTKPCL